MQPSSLFGQNINKAPQQNQRKLGLFDQPQTDTKNKGLFQTIQTNANKVNSFQPPQPPTLFNNQKYSFGNTDNLFKLPPPLLNDSKKQKELTKRIDQLNIEAGTLKKQKNELITLTSKLKEENKNLKAERIQNQEYLNEKIEQLTQQLKQKDQEYEKQRIKNKQTIDLLNKKLSDQTRQFQPQRLRFTTVNQSQMLEQGAKNEQKLQQLKKNFLSKLQYQKKQLINENQYKINRLIQSHEKQLEKHKKLQQKKFKQDKIELEQHYMQENQEIKTEKDNCEKKYQKIIGKLKQKMNRENQNVTSQFTKIKKQYQKILLKVNSDRNDRERMDGKDDRGDMGGQTKESLKLEQMAIKHKQRQNKYKVKITKLEKKIQQMRIDTSKQQGKQVNQSQEEQKDWQSQSIDFDDKENDSINSKTQDIIKSHRNKNNLSSSQQLRQQTIKISDQKVQVPELKFMSQQQRYKINHDDNHSSDQNNRNQDQKDNLNGGKRIQNINESDFVSEEIVSIKRQSMSERFITQIKQISQNIDQRKFYRYFNLLIVLAIIYILYATYFDSLYETFLQTGN